MQPDERTPFLFPSIESLHYLSAIMSVSTLRYEFLNFLLMISIYEKKIKIIIILKIVTIDLKFNNEVFQIPKER